jgi:hypothetical protein
MSNLQFSAGIDKVQARFRSPIMEDSYQFKKGIEGAWRVGSCSEVVNEFGEAEIGANVRIYSSEVSSLVISHNINLDLAHVTVNPTTAYRKTDIENTFDMAGVIAHVKNEMQLAGIVNADDFDRAELMRLDIAKDCTLKHATELYLPALTKNIHYVRPATELKYKHGNTWGNASHQFGVYNRSLHLIENKDVPAEKISPLLTRAEVRLFNKGADTWKKNYGIEMIKCLPLMSGEEYLEMYYQQFRKLRAIKPALTKKHISIMETLLNYKRSYNKGAMLYNRDKSLVEFYHAYGHSATVDAFSKGSKSSKQDWREYLRDALDRYPALCVEELNERELISEFIEAFA